MARIKFQEGCILDSGIVLLQRLPNRRFKVRYICGHEKVVCGLPKGKTGLCLSCTEKLPTTTSHGHARRSGESPTYSSWSGMRARCYKECSPRYERYGGRGITVCDDWLHSFETFLADMGERPEGCTLDRIDNDGNYEPSNCRWVDAVTQSKSKSNTIKVAKGGEIFSLRNACSLEGIDYKSTWRKVRKEGVDVSDILGIEYTLMNA